MSTATLRHLSHRDDPASSGEAIAQLDATGGRAKHMEIVYGLVKSHPDSTAIELMEHGPLGEYQVRRRLYDLHKAGRVAQGEIRKCRVRGTKMVVWRAVGGGSAA